MHIKSIGGVEMILNYKSYKAKRAENKRKERIQNLMEIANEIYRIEDVGDEIVLTVKGCKAMPITNLEEGVAMLKKLREDYVNNKIAKS